MGAVTAMARGMAIPKTIPMTTAMATAKATGILTVRRLRISPGLPQGVTR